MARFQHLRPRPQIGLLLEAGPLALFVVTGAAWAVSRTSSSFCCCGIVHMQEDPEKAIEDTEFVVMAFGWVESPGKVLRDLRFVTSVVIAVTIDGSGT